MRVLAILTKVKSQPGKFLKKKRTNSSGHGSFSEILRKFSVNIERFKSSKCGHNTLTKEFLDIEIFFPN